MERNERLWERLLTLLDAPYLVYYTYDLEPSMTPESPSRAREEADQRRIQEYLRTHPGAKVRWLAHRPGNEPS
jgi:hypothetical protein